VNEDFAICVSSEARLQRVDQERAIPPELADELLSDLEDLGVPSSEVRLEMGSAGYGAEVLTILTIVTSLLAMGPLVEENLSAWPSIGKRIARVMGRLRGKEYNVMVSEPVALALAISELSESGISVEGARLVASHVLPVRGGSISKEMITSFQRQPDRFYLFIVCTADDDTHVVIARSSGEVEEIRRLPTGSWLEYYGITS